ncbi:MULTISPECIES: enoyl-CoA hydratase/isomerase family protein [unclassified Rhodococcus (in: high G+C Gram-positive bacteria)]|uniref:enoyl-CoA hydratase/isomerase family protein n=1 Tax=unclassified Rhodococcus (in: high G+C Gram-positive bacteria) TaxID=192944 RepID=UPI001C528376|nr:MULTISPECIES: enoyl-CoA hydratase/isomerase family protein [unclassified Rhodococcus (in: high G+C Gram-positive bacteria)]
MQTIDGETNYPASAPGTTHFRRQGAVGVIELDNGPFNLVSRSLISSFDDSISAAAEDDEVRAVVVTARGPKAFCAGSDIGEFDDYATPGAVVDLKLRFQNEVFDKLEGIPKPTIAALDGLAFGGGLEIALCCDLIVAHQDVRVALPELRIGVFPSSGGPIRLARRVGSERAKYMILTTDPITADDAQRFGLISEVVYPGTALARAVILAHQFTNLPELGIGAIKNLISSSYTMPGTELRSLSLALSDAAFTSSDCAEGVAAFRMNREPLFGRRNRP